MIPAHVMRELRYIEISTPRAIRNARIGPYTSRPRGPGFDFEQHLVYRPGDDVRRIDWNVTARLNAPYVRQTHAERQLDVVLAVDVSRSMDVGSGGWTKREAMTFVTASLLFSAEADDISMGLLAFSDRVLAWMPPRRVAGRAWRMLEEIWALHPPHTTAVLPAVRHLAATLRTMSVVVLVSDFLTPEAPFVSPELRLLAARHDVIAVLLEDPADASLPEGRGFIRTRDVETGRQVAVALNNSTREAFARTAARRRRTIREHCLRFRIDPVFVPTNRPITQPVMEAFARRRSA